jgi:hypothetical protein
VVRADVAIRGPRVEGAIAALADLISADLEALDSLPVHFVAGVALADQLASCKVSGR